MNKRIYKLYTGTLSNMRLVGSYSKKKTTVSDPTKASITASEGAVNGTQRLKVTKLATPGYLTGATVSIGLGLPESLQQQGMIDLSQNISVI